MSFVVAVTRPEPQATDTARALERVGYTVVLAPLLRLAPADDPGRADGIGTLALTSRTAARLLAGRPEFHGIPVAAVGDGTAAEASRAGFRRVSSADGDVDALLALLRGVTGPIVHMTGEDHRGALVERIRATGRIAERRVIYRMEAADRLPACPRVDAALLYSPRTAEVFARLATEGGWQAAAAVAISAATAEPLAGRAVSIATHPDEASLLSALADLRADAASA